MRVWTNNFRHSENLLCHFENRNKKHATGTGEVRKNWKWSEKVRKETTKLEEKTTLEDFLCVHRHPNFGRTFLTKLLAWARYHERSRWSLSSAGFRRHGLVFFVDIWTISFCCWGCHFRFLGASVLRADDILFLLQTYGMSRPKLGHAVVVENASGSVNVQPLESTLKQMGLNVRVHKDCNKQVRNWDHTHREHHRRILPWALSKPPCELWSRNCEVIQKCTDGFTPLFPLYYLGTGSLKEMDSQRRNSHTQQHLSLDCHCQTGRKRNRLLQRWPVLEAFRFGAGFKCCRQSERNS